MKRIGILSILVLFLYSAPVFGQQSTGSGSTLSGKVFTDYYWMAKNHNPDIQGENGFWIRRIYMTHEYTFNEAFSSRVRLEMNSAGDFETSAEMMPTVKDAYLKWQNDRHQIFAGISSTPTWGLTEDVWGYRSVEKSPLDLYDFGSSRDMGLSFKGELGNSGNLNYHLFLGNGNSNKPEINTGKKVMFSLAYNVTEHIVVQGYADYNESGDEPGSRDSFTSQVFAGYQSEQLNIGALYANQQREGLLGAPNRSLDLVSVFANAKFSDTVKGYLRADHMFDPYVGGSDNSYIPFAENAESTFLVGGADISLQENIHLMPNIEAIVYGEGTFGQSPDTDIIPRVTLFYEF